MENETFAGDERGARPIEHSGPDGGGLDVEPPALGFRHRELIGTPGIEPSSDRLRMQRGRDLPPQFDRVHRQLSSAINPARLSSGTPASINRRSKLTGAATIGLVFDL
ncbi:hypothetical protein ASNO1_23720 [Corallococcus caeni]|uniref:Uncharacterized protein n=1 Tax=Corallococcus caeni TaxID=3082388 RepID=A0ABQ6QR10_9BACT|nr:hypothetical protein ASNO1_23720 [Corallococcus sp. NO1]